MKSKRVVMTVLGAVIFGGLGAWAGEFLAGKGSLFAHVFPAALVGALVGWAASAPKSVKR